MRYILRSINYSKVVPKKIVSSRKYNAALHIDGFHSVKTTSTSFQPRSMFHFENRAIWTPDRLQNSPYFCVFKYARAVKQKVSCATLDRFLYWFWEKNRLFCSLNFRVFTVRDTKIGSELHTKLYKGAWNVSANNAETEGHKDLRFGKIVYILIFFNISLYWLPPLDFFQFILFVPCLLRVSEKRKIRSAE